MPDLPPTLTPVRCASCGLDVPSGSFCGACGAPLGGDDAGNAHRRTAFAASPGEHVFHLNVIGTLFPHLPHRRRAPFQIALIGSVVLLTGLGMLGLVAPAIGLAAVAVPILYLLYMYEVEVYKDEPWLVVAVTMVLGAVLGAIWALTIGPVVTGMQTHVAVAGAGASEIVLGGILLPAAAQILMLIGALVLFFARSHFDEALDGFTFGVAAALGFTLAVTMIELAPLLHAGLVSTRPGFDNFATLIIRGTLQPVVNASTTGLVAGALWLSRGTRRAAGDHPASTSIISAVVVAIVLQAALGSINLLPIALSGVLLCYLAAAAFLLLWVRLALHHFLLAEAVEVSAEGTGICSHCHREVPRMAFCPNCGIATRATPKVGDGRLERTTR